MPAMFPQKSLFQAIVALNLLGSCLGAIVERVEDLPGLDYDFIIIGGGTAGLVVANRLTEIPTISVLVLEAGGSNEGVFNSMVPFFNGKLFQTDADWNYTTLPQEGLGGRSGGYPAGHILGGTSSMSTLRHNLTVSLLTPTRKDGLAYTRGSSDDYDRYARITGDSGWSWNSIQPYLRKNEIWTPPADHHDTRGEFNPAVHGFHGINAVSLPAVTYPFDRRVVQATSELPDEFPFNLDMNSGHHIGIGWTQSTIKGGERSSSATSYLAPRFAQRKNLHVLVRARVSRVVQTGSKLGMPLFTSVEFSNGLGDTLKRVTARKEVIVSSGVIGTPHLLLNSGFGDSATLSRIGIKPLVHLPSVGQNLTDHAFVANTWQVNSTDTFESAIRNATLMEEQLKQWNETRMGPYAASTFNLAGWLRVPDDSSIFDKVPDPSAGPHTGHFEFIIANGMTRLPVPPTGNYMVIGTVVITPLSRGSVELATNNPFDLPKINPNLMAADLDLLLMREAIHSVRRFAKAPVWKDYIIAAVDTAETDAELEQFIRSTAQTVSHAVGTSAMSPRGAGYGVVDPDLRVKKVAGLRVVDASVLPLVPAAHTQVATYVVAERASDLIKAAWGL
ncbi:aryl-alcohol oxidase-like protein [Collybia nuda]|uniref:Aryl-alcohol oxidase-like protein n=1 Tax=Collybia nuda TaxID=64659 RepID=A0A9P5YBC7_9AGAR|nr:aryl-alcohol oxidase-like protein [Collybia nuda]